MSENGIRLGFIIRPGFTQCTPTRNTIYRTPTTLRRLLSRGHWSLTVFLISKGYPHHSTSLTTLYPIRRYDALPAARIERGLLLAVRCVYQKNTVDVYY